MPKTPRARKRDRKKFVAYNVGRTAFGVDDIDKLANYVIEHMKEQGSYNVLENNCQHFIQALMRRIVMCRRTPIAVRGTLREIAAWDKGDPSLTLKPWLTKAKARLLLFPVKEQSQRPSTWHKKWQSRASHKDHWPSKVQKFLDSDRGPAIARALCTSDQPVNKLMQELKAKDTIVYKVFDSLTAPIFAVLVGLIVLIACWGSLCLWSWHFEKNPLLREVFLTLEREGFPIDNYLAKSILKETFAVSDVAVALPLILARALVGRSSLSVTHYNIFKKRAGKAHHLKDGDMPLPYPPMDEDCNKGDKRKKPAFTVSSSEVRPLDRPPKLPPRPHLTNDEAVIIETHPPAYDTPPPPYTPEATVSREGSSTAWVPTYHPAYMQPSVEDWDDADDAECTDDTDDTNDADDVDDAELVSLDFCDQLLIPRGVVDPSEAGNIRHEYQTEDFSDDFESAASIILEDLQLSSRPPPLPPR